MEEIMQIFVGIIGLTIVGYSWFRHYSVPDGLGRIMLLWGNAFVFGMIFFRTLGYILFDCGILNIETSKTWNQFNFFFIYAIVIGQFIILEFPGNEKKYKKRKK